MVFTLPRMSAYRTVCDSADSNHAAFLTVIPRSPTIVNRTVLLHPASPQHNNGRCGRVEMQDSHVVRPPRAGRAIELIALIRHRHYVGVRRTARPAELT
jgi:hypothetical protein